MGIGFRRILTRAGWRIVPILERSRGPIRPLMGMASKEVDKLNNAYLVMKDLKRVAKTNAALAPAKKLQGQYVNQMIKRILKGK